MRLLALAALALALGGCGDRAAPPTSPPDADAAADAGSAALDASRARAVAALADVSGAVAWRIDPDAIATDDNRVSEPLAAGTRLLPVRGFGLYPVLDTAEAYLGAEQWLELRTLLETAHAVPDSGARHMCGFSPGIAVLLHHADGRGVVLICLQCSDAHVQLPGGEGLFTIMPVHAGMVRWAQRAFPADAALRELDPDRFSAPRGDGLFR